MSWYNATLEIGDSRELSLTMSVEKKSLSKLSNTREICHFHLLILMRKMAGNGSPVGGLLPTNQLKGEVTFS